MKRLIATIGLTALTSMAFAQNVLDAVVYSKTDPVLGNARYSGMAGAFTALGGNASAIKDNPAALGVFRSHDITFSPNLYINNDGDVKGSLNNFAAVINFGGKREKTSGVICSSLGINYNRMNNISRYTRKNETLGLSLTDAIGEAGAGNLHNDFAYEIGLIDDNNQSVFGGKSIDRNLSLSETGHVGQWDIAYGMNVNNLIYWGVALGINTIDYKQTAMYDETSDTPMADGSVSKGDSWYLDNICEMKGNGVNFRAGLIIRPMDVLRIGASIETPTLYDIKEYNSVELGDKQNYCKEDYDGAPVQYTLKTPLKVKAGVGFVVGKRALIDIDYQYENQKKLRLESKDMKLDDQTDLAEEMMCKTHTIKAGTEVQIVNGFCLRAGLGYSSKPMNDYTAADAYNTFNFRPISIPQQSIYVSGGAGYKGEHFYCDLAYAFRNTKNILYTYLPLEPGDNTLEENLKTRNIIATLGWRF